LICPFVYFGLFVLNKYPGVKKKKKKKWLKMFRLRRAPLHYNKFHLGKKYISRRGGGKKFEFQILYTPLQISIQNDIPLLYIDALLINQ